MTPSVGMPVSAFIQASLREALDPSQLAAVRARANAGRVNWDACRSEAGEQKLEPLLYATLAGQGVLPGWLEEQWRTAYRRSAARNVLVMRAVARIVAQLSGAGVPLLLLKGCALAVSVYADEALRPMSDIDLLVRREDVPAAVEALAAIGYSAATTEVRAGLDLDYENEMILPGPGTPSIPLELHWSLLNSPHYQRLLSSDWWWRTAQPSSAELGSALVLGPEATLLHLCGHLALHHASSGTLWLHDVAAVLYRLADRVDWSLVLERAGSCDLVLPLQQVLPAVAEGWGAPVPATVLASLAGLEPSAEEARVFGWLTSPARPVAQRFYADLASIPGWRHRLRFGAANLFPSAAYMRRRYGIRQGWLLPFFYPYRWWVGLRGLAGLNRRQRPAPSDGPSESGR